jgi:hypothetical protein
MTDDQVRERIDEYCARYGVKDRNEAGFPTFPAGLRETAQHREWITLYKLFSRSRRRSGTVVSAPPAGSEKACPVCLERGTLGRGGHKRCAVAVDLVRGLGPEALDRIRAAAFPTEGGPAVPARARRRP